MGGRSETRDRVLEAAAELFRQQGYCATGLNQVVAHGAAPKGSLYFHFPGGKEQLAVEAVAWSGREVGERLAAAVAESSDVRGAIIAIGEVFADELERSEYRAGCPVATVALEAAAGSEPIRAACDGTYAAWLGGLADYLRRSGMPEQSAEPIADLVLSAVQGALLLARVRHDAAVVRSTSRQVADVAAAAIANGRT